MRNAFLVISLLCLGVILAGCIGGPKPEDLGVKPGEVFRATGRGAPPPDAVNEAQASLLALRAAKLDACRNLLEAVKGVQITSKTRVEDYITTQDRITSAVGGLLQGVVVDREEEMPDGSWEVEVYITYEQLKKILQSL